MTSEKATADYDTLIEEIKNQTPDEKAKMLVGFMSGAISSDTEQNFKDFWRAKTVLMELFKEKLDPIVRATVWDEFNRLCKEARLMQDHIDKEASFEIEQIEKALAAIEQEMAHLDERAEKVEGVEIPRFPKNKQALGDRFSRLRKKLHLLDSACDRLVALRDEIIKMQVRISRKNGLLNRLSKVGDVAFPERKALGSEMSEMFEKMCEDFMQSNFAERAGLQLQSRVPLKVLVDEIKQMQRMAKQFRVSGPVWRKTREMLSKAWEVVNKEFDAKRKADEGMKEVFEANCQRLMDKIEALKVQTKKENFEKQVGELYAEVKRAQVGTTHQESLKKALEAKENAFYDQVKSGIEQEDQQIKNRAKKREEQIEQLVKEIEAAHKGMKKQPLEALDETLVGFDEVINQINPILDEEILYMSELNGLIEHYLELSEDEENSALNYRMDRKKYRTYLKSLLSRLKEAGKSCGLDLEKMFVYQEIYAEEKKRFDGLDS